MCVSNESEEISSDDLLVQIRERTWFLNFIIGMFKLEAVGPIVKQIRRRPDGTKQFPDSLGKLEASIGRIYCLRLDQLIIRQIRGEDLIWRCEASGSKTQRERTPE